MLMYNGAHTKGACNSESHTFNSCLKMSHSKHYFLLPVYGPEQPQWDCVDSFEALVQLQEITLDYSTLSPFYL